MSGSSQIAGLNAGYVGLVLEQYLENPEAVDPAWRALFENADDEVLAALPGLTRLVGTRPVDDGNGGVATAVAPPAPPGPPAEPSPPSPPPAEAPPEPEPAPAAEAEPVDIDLLRAVAAAVSVVKAIRMHGHLGARLDPLGSEPPGDPALEPRASTRR